MPTAGFVLAGGSSSRMGTNKALLIFHGRTLLEIAASAVREAAGNVTIIGDVDLYGHFGLPVTPDLRAGAGPLAGIETALTAAKASGANWSLITACDMPRLAPVGLRAILKETSSESSAVLILPESRPGQVEPLCAAWNIRALPFISRALDAGTRKVTQAIPQNLVRCVRLTHEEVFQNLNTPEEWRLALERP